MFIQVDRSDEGDYHNDNELWTAFREGNRKALSALFMRYYDTLLRYGLKLISDEDMTRDGIQEMFLRLWEKRENIADADSVKFYLLLSLRRTLFRMQDRNASREQRNVEFGNNQFDSFDNIESKIIDQELEEERKTLYRQALNELTNRQKEILFLRLHHGMKNKEIAEMTGLTHQRVRNYMSEAVSKLKEHIFDARMSN